MTWVKRRYLDSKKLLKSLATNLKSLIANLQKSQAYHWLDPRNYRGLERTLHSIGLLIMAGLILFSSISPLVDIYVTHKYYSLNSITSGLVGNVSDTLAKQITYDSTKNAYVFNASGMTPTTQTVGPDKVPLSLLQAKVAGNNSKSKSTYSVVMPTDPKAGIGYYDSNTGLSFQLVPNFTEMSAQQVNNHIVYPTSTNTQLVYSVKNNGLKEDIVLKQYTTDSLSFSYSLKLPKTLEARMLTDGSGSLGIYSADPSLFGSGSSLGNDPAKIESAQLHAQKDHLVFAIPAPVIKQTGNSGQGTATANFKLSQDGQTLTVRADNLRGLHYPITVDPTVVITSTSDFSTGNNEDNNITYPAGQINRGSLTGGSISGGWTATTVLPVATAYATSVAYNGYIYEIGGNNAPTTTTVYYASINANGTIGAWTATTALPVATNGATSVAYNGYLYEIGGAGGPIVNTVYYAPINSNGSIGAWSTTTALSAVTAYASSVVYSGYLYEIGGYNGTSILSTVSYAPINANGTIGSWATTTALPTATTDATSVAYNGFVYEIGGTTGSLTATVSYAPINANGTIGSWATTTALPTATRYATSVVLNGYIYEIGGNTGSTTSAVYYAPINANGTISAWTTSTSLTTVNQQATSIAYNGYIYEIGGFNGTANITTVSYAKIDPAGTTKAYSTTTALPGAISYSTSVAYNGCIYEIGGYLTANVWYSIVNATGDIGGWNGTTALPTATYDATSVVYNGYLYLIGGYNSSSATVVVDYAPINSNCTLGSWTATNSLLASTTSYNATSVVYNGYVYEIGGNLTAVVQYAPINTNGTLGTWTATTSLPANTASATSVTYNGYIYVMGGNTGAATANVYYALINSNGTIGSWTATTSLVTATQYATSVIYNGYVYVIGGWNGTTYFSTVNYAPLNSNGTIGSWVANTSLPATTTYATSVVYNGYVYEIGGGTGSSVATVYYAFINNGGPGTVGAWTATTGLPTAINWATSVAYNGYVYEIGGNSGSATLAFVYFAPINANGTIGTWAATTSLPTTTYYANSVAYNGYLYEIGGDNGSAAISAVLYAPINTDGTIGAWTATTALPTTNNRSTAVAYNGYLYEIGGYDGAANVATVNFAPINANGSIGAWTATTALPTATRFAASVVYNGYLYAIGGYTSAPIATVEYAPINANGTIGSWVATTYLPIATSVTTSVAYNGYIYAIGGDNPSITATVSYASINANGTVGVWNTTTSLPAATDHATSVVYNGYIYEIGGWNGSATITTVNYAPLNVMPRVGHHSQLFSFSSPITPVSITYNGKLPNAYGLSPIQYRIASSNGIFGTSQYSSALAGTSTSCTPSSAQYVETSLTLDDSGSAAFPDVNATSANVTDFTVTYSTAHPQPNMRLRGGKFFFKNSLTPLDTCALPPSAPTIGTATAGNMSATVTFTDNAAGDAPISSHTVTAYPGGLTGTGSSPVTVSGLTNGVSYSFTVTATSAKGVSAPSAASNSITPGSIVTGGTLYADATYYYRTFTSSGTLGITGAPLTADYLVIAGGGAGASIDTGTNNASGGGGAGGYISATAQSLSASNYTVTVGAGGTVNSTATGPSNGGNSVFNSLTAIGGGAGGQYNTTTTGNAGLNGGSGGGSRVGGAIGLGTTGQGFDGGMGGNQGGGGGGGGAGGAGVSRVLNEVNGGTGGTGSNAHASWLAATGLGVSGFIAGGGGGGSASTGVGGTASAGGGSGATYDTSPAGSGLANSGGGGGGAGGTAGALKLGGAGGSGVVIIRYLRTAVALPVANGGTLASDSTYFYRTFTSSGTFSVSGGVIAADILTVGGGGGGASGGGGAGGVVYSASQNLTETSYTVTVGAGGTAGSGGGGATVATVGGNSQFGTLTAALGGGNGARIGDMGVSVGGNGASGGGGGAWSAGTTTGGTGSQGSNGGGNGGFVAAPYPAGGGGGFGGIGGNASGATIGGVGGAGINTYSSWATATGTGVGGSYAGGGGGAVYAGGGSGGTASAGGGAGNVNGVGGINGTAGTPNSGGGGGGGQASGNGGNGGSGVVIIRYLKTAVAPPPIVTGGILASDATYYYRTFLANGTFSITGGSVTADVLIIGGGGGGGNSGGGGGGAGYVNLLSSYSVTNGSYSMTIGAGGAGGTNNTTGNATIGGTSSAFGTNAVGGGPGGGYQSNAPATGTFGNGGGGGNGQSGNNGTSTTGNAGSIVIGGLTHNAYSGGGVSPTTTGNMAGHGGAGAAQNGFGATGNYSVSTVSSTWYPGNGGAGTNTFSTWATATGTGVGGYYAGGGAGGYASGSNGAVGGAGGGGSAPYPYRSVPGLAGAPNTGGGGAGSGGATPDVGGAGGSGIIIIRYTRSQVGG